MAEEPLAVDTVGMMISGVVVTAMRNVMKGGMIGWIGGAHKITIAGMIDGMIEVCLRGAQYEEGTTYGFAVISVIFAIALFSFAFCHCIWKWESNLEFDLNP